EEERDRAPDEGAQRESGQQGERCVLGRAPLLQPDPAQKIVRLGQSGPELIGDVSQVHGESSFEIHARSCRWRARLRSARASPPCEGRRRTPRTLASGSRRPLIAGSTTGEPSPPRAVPSRTGSRRRAAG